MQAIQRSTTFIVEVRPPQLLALTKEAIREFFGAWKAYKSQIVLKKGESYPLMYLFVDQDLMEMILRKESAAARCSNAAAEELSSSESDNDIKEEKISLEDVRRDLERQEEEVLTRLKTDEGLKTYLLKEYGPKSVLASLQIYQGIQMPLMEVSRLSMNAAAIYVQRFDAAREWCANFDIPKRRLAEVFLKGINPTSLRTELGLLKTRNYVTLSSFFLLRYSQLCEKYEDVASHFSPTNASLSNGFYAPKKNQVPGRTHSNRSLNLSRSNDFRKSYENKICDICGEMGHIKHNCEKFLEFKRQQDKPRERPSQFSNVPNDGSFRRPQRHAEHSRDQQREHPQEESRQPWRTPRAASPAPAKREPTKVAWSQDSRRVHFDQPASVWARKPGHATASSGVGGSSSFGRDRDHAVATKGPPVDARGLGRGNNYDTPAGRSEPTRHVSNKMLFSSNKTMPSGIPTVMVSLESPEVNRGADILLRAQLDSGSEANIISSQWEHCLHAIGLQPTEIDPITVGWIQEGHTFKVKRVVTAHTRVLSYSGIPQGVDLTYLVMDGAGEEVIIGISAMRQLNLLQHADAVIAVQTGLGLLYSMPSAEEDPVIPDLAGEPIDVEDRYGHEARDLESWSEPLRLQEPDTVVAPTLSRRSPPELPPQNAQVNYLRMNAVTEEDLKEIFGSSSDEGPHFSPTTVPHWETMTVNNIHGRQVPNYCTQLFQLVRYFQRRRIRRGVDYVGRRKILPSLTALCRRLRKRGCVNSSA